MPSRFRKSYISQRVQCTERGRGVAQFTLLDEVGHSDFKLIKRVYGKRYKRHQNPELVEWRLEHHHEAQQRLNADKAPRGSLRVVA